MDEQFSILREKLIPYLESIAQMAVEAQDSEDFDELREYVSNIESDLSNLRHIWLHTIGE